MANQLRKFGHSCSLMSEHIDSDHLLYNSSIWGAVLGKDFPLFASYSLVEGLILSQKEPYFCWP